MLTHSPQHRPSRRLRFRIHAVPQRSCASPRVESCVCGTPRGGLSLRRGLPRGPQGVLLFLPQLLQLRRPTRARCQRAGDEVHTRQVAPCWGVGVETNGQCAARDARVRLQGLQTGAGRVGDGHPVQKCHRPVPGRATAQRSSNALRGGRVVPRPGEATVLGQPVCPARARVCMCVCGVVVVVCADPVWWCTLTHLLLLCVWAVVHG